MPDILFTAHCAIRDQGAVVEAIRSCSPAPIHVRTEAVRGRDFSDAGTAERVSGELRRAAIELIIDRQDLPALLESLRAARRDLSLRWRTTPLLDHGRIA